MLPVRGALYSLFVRIKASACSLLLFLHLNSYYWKQFPIPLHCNCFRYEQSGSTNNVSVDYRNHIEIAWWTVSNSEGSWKWLHSSLRDHGWVRGGRWWIRSAQFPAVAYSSETHSSLSFIFQSLFCFFRRVIIQSVCTLFNEGLIHFIIHNFFRFNSKKFRW